MKTLQGLFVVAAMSLTSVSYTDASGRSGTRDVSGQTLIGTEVQTLTGESLGEVTAVIDDKKGYARYAVISHGGILGWGIKRIAVPWATVQSVLQNDKLMMDRAHVEKAPVLSGSQTPDLSSSAWSRAADRYWNGKIATRETPYTPQRAERSGSSPIVPAPTPITERT
jgi:sporulation protein YlmC with PRC-barrel domain